MITLKLEPALHMTLEVDSIEEVGLMFKFLRWATEEESIEGHRIALGSDGCQVIFRPQDEAAIRSWFDANVL